MKLLRSMALAFTLLCPYLLLSQTALQEISRITYPNNCNFIPNVIANGDINGDGHPDLIYSVVDNNIAGGGYAQIYIYHNIPDSTTQPDQILTPPSNLYGWYGFAVSYGGDLNGDGIDDLVVGSSNYDIWATGAVSIYYGGTTLSSQPDLTLFGSDYDDFDDTCLRFGQRVLTDCDLNGDGYDDLVVNGDGPQDYWFGHVWAFLGGQQFNTTCAFNKRGTVMHESFGERLTTGDINGDGKDDIILTKRINVIDEYNYDIALDIHSGGDSLSNISAFEIILGSSSSQLGKVVANGDLNGDGYEDILILMGTSLGPMLRVIYGCSILDSLDIQDYYLPMFGGEKLISYCNVNNDSYSDFCMQQMSMTEGGIENGNFLVHKQTNPTLDLIYDFISSGQTDLSGYGYGYYLGDMNQDGYPEFFVYKNDYSQNYLSNYACILSEQYVGNDDETIPVPDADTYCYPNPFKSSTTITCSFPHKMKCNLEIFNIKGQKVRTLVNGTQAKGKHSIIWNGKDDNGKSVSSGMYFYKLTTPERVITNKMIMLK